MSPLMPKIFIGVLTYNYGVYLSAALQSILDQSYQHWEVLICDDASTDNTLEVIKLFLDNPKIRYFRHNENHGQPYNWGYMINNSNGDYIATLHGDDAWEINYLEVMVEHIIDDSSLELIWSNWAICDQYLKPSGNIGPVINSKKLCHPETFDHLVKFNHVLPSTTIFSIKKAREIGLPDLNLNRFCDREYFLRLARVVKYSMSVSNVLVKYRCHNLSETHLSQYKDNLLFLAEETQYISNKFPSISAGLPEAVELNRFFSERSALQIRQIALEEAVRYSGKNTALLFKMSKEIYKNPETSFRHRFKELLVMTGFAWLIRLYRKACRVLPVKSLWT